MNSSIVRQRFLDYFKLKEHSIVPSAPMVIRNDPTLMFTNAGMNQFKNIFLDDSPAKQKRVANTQKCLRVSGKHNDLEEVGHDTYHHTMFEMLGNWSFGDYFKKEAIAWAWEFLTDELKIGKDRLYATVFEGSKQENIEKDKEAFNFWKEYLDESRILFGSKKDNFWEMGDIGPCGPCSEIHIDLRSDRERKANDGANLINKDHPEVIEIWNLVFIQFNRKANGTLIPLSRKHIDTGMGFERLCMVVQGKTSNYDTDLFRPIIEELSGICKIRYGDSKKSDIAMRVVADHLRAISFAIADGQLPSNVKAGYVIRRILRRAVRYYFTFLNRNEPLIYKLVPVLIKTMGDTFTEIKAQQQFIEKVIREEELSFLRTLETGIKLLDQIISKTKSEKYKVVSGVIAFELYDTYGFPLDLTELILKEHNLTVNRKEFEKEMIKQKERSKSAGTVEAEEWNFVDGAKDEKEEFVGYDSLETEVKITRYRKIKSKDGESYHLVFNHTPFYAESGGQVGDSGYIDDNKEKIKIINTIKENNLTIHITKKLPARPESKFRAVVNIKDRIDTANNHTATHLLHYALKKVLGSHVEQKGSLVHPDYLRFDFSHYQKISDDELLKIESIVNDKIRDNISREENRSMPLKEAKKAGAIALFGEKYDDLVRVIKFSDSIELCGGTHVESTGQIGYFKIISESAIAAGIRRIEAISGTKAEEYINNQSRILKKINELLKYPQDLEKSVKSLIDENAALQKDIEQIKRTKVRNLKSELINKIKKVKNVNLIAEKIDINSADAIRDLAFQLRRKVENLYMVVGANLDGKANITIMISDNLVKDKNLNASQIIKDIAKEINGGGGGQPFFATAGGNDPGGIDRAIKKAIGYIK
ncbi:MAG: alanine--tRNA ligase [Bacteroidales bacterium]|nr:MAG: alanine--tRNA ligase [Bacteroidales bacterium]